MKFENMVGKEFDNISQRVIYPYIVLYPEFNAVLSDEVSEEAQRQMNEFIKNTIITLYNNPELIEMSVDKDDYYIFGQMNKDRPELYDLIRKLEKKFLTFFNFLYNIGLAGNIKDKTIIHNSIIYNSFYIPKTFKALNKKKQAILESLGLVIEVEKDNIIVYSKEYPELCLGWKELSKISKSLWSDDDSKAIVVKTNAKFAFMKCLFGFKDVTLSRVCGDLEQSGTYLHQIEEYLVKKGYEIFYDDGNPMLQKIYPKKQEGNFRVFFTLQNKNQLVYAIRIPDFTTLVTVYFEHMDEELKEFIFARIGKCSGCGYCTQTDKSGKRKRLAVALEMDGEVIGKCPLYPNLGWDRLDENAVYMIKKLLDFAEETLYK